MVRLSLVLFFVAAVASAHSVVDVGLSFDVPAFVPTNQNFRYRIIADDRANDMGLGIVVTVVLPSQVKFAGVTKDNTWKCTQSQQTVTCSADTINPGPNPIDINVTAPGVTTSMHAAANVQSIGSFDGNSLNDNAVADVIAFDGALCTAASPEIASPADGASVAPVVPLRWSAVPGAQSYTINTTVEGASAGSLDVIGTSVSIPAEPGVTEWWVTANFATCPPSSSAHAHFNAATTLQRPVRVFAGDLLIGVTQDGSLGSATFRAPYGLAFNTQDLPWAARGTLYVTDQADQVVRQIVNGNVTTITGRAGMAGNTDGQFALFNTPRGIAVTPLDGLIYAVDSRNDEVRILYPGGPFIPAYNAGGSPGAPGMVDSTSDKARFNTPSGVAASSRGSLYVADTGNNRIRRMDQVTGYLGYFNVSTVAAGFHSPLGVALDANEAVYIADTDAGNIVRADGTVVAGGFDHPTGIAFDSRGNLFVTEGTSVRRIAPSGRVTTVATGFIAPAGIAIDSADRAYVADPNAHVIYVIDPAQIATRKRPAR